MGGKEPKRIRSIHSILLPSCHEETGHENMALRDIRSLGFDVSAVSQMRPLPATETLTAYLYWISVQGNPVQRLGYSF